MANHYRNVYTCAIINPADNRTLSQKAPLWQLLKELIVDYPHAHIVGHNELPRIAKACPCFSCKTKYAEFQPK